MHAEPLVEAVVGDEPARLVEMGVRAGDDDLLDLRDQPRLLEHVDDERLATEQQELLGERSPDALADPPGEHDHPDLHAVLRSGWRSAIAYVENSRPVGTGIIRAGPRPPDA